MKKEKEYPTINPKTGKPFSAKFIESMKKHAKNGVSEEERQKIIASNKRTIHKRQTFQSVAKMMLEMAPKPEIVEKLREFLPGMSDKEITNRVAMMQKMIEKALQGDSYSFQIVRDTAGEKPVEKQEVIGTVANTYTQVDKEEIKKALIDAKKVLNELE